MANTFTNTTTPIRVKATNSGGRSAVWLPFLFATTLAVGMVIGFRLQGIQNKNNHAGNAMSLANIGGGSALRNRIEEILRYAESNYVDPVDREKLETEAINCLLDNLDPHSAYIPAAELQTTNEELDGEFVGIGIEFVISRDTVGVINVIPNGPSEKVGLHAGDRLVRIGSANIAGVKVTNEQLVEKLRGKKGSKVQVGIVRAGTPQVISFDITRNVIPIVSLDAAYMAAPTIGYIKLNKFSEKTPKEFMDAAEQLEKQGMKSLIIDLRGNGGGYLNAATSILEQFFTDPALLVYTRGRNNEKQEYEANGHPVFKFGKLVVLIDETSASASEIVAGALQDHDRATIIGRRSFGKGLVQEQYDLSDGSALRLTVARYFTPSGRCIQKPYKNRNRENYDEDLEDRFKHGEFLSADSIHQTDTTKFRTDKGRIVYGGGGIMPDVFVPLDTAGNNPYFQHAQQYLSEFAYDYETKHKPAFAAYTDLPKFAASFRTDEATVAAFTAFATAHGVKSPARQVGEAKNLVAKYLKAYFARQLFQDKGYYYILNYDDAAVKRAVATLGGK